MVKQPARRYQLAQDAEDLIQPSALVPSSHPILVRLNLISAYS